MILKLNIRSILAVAMGLIVVSAWSNPAIADSDGSQVYKKACKKCHGKMGHGKPSKADSSQFKYPPIYELSEEDLLKAMAIYIELWQKKTYDKNEKRMAKSAGKLSDEETQAVVAFITSQLSPKAE